MKERIEKFKGELKYLYSIQAEIKRLSTRIAIIEYEEENVKGIDYSKEHGTYNPEAVAHRRLAVIEKKETLMKLLEAEEKKEEAIGLVLKQMSEEDRELVLEVIAERRKYKDVCKERNIANTSSLFAMIEKIIGEALTKLG